MFFSRLGPRSDIFLKGEGPEAKVRIGLRYVDVGFEFCLLFGGLSVQNSIRDKLRRLSRLIELFTISKAVIFANKGLVDSERCWHVRCIGRPTRTSLSADDRRVIIADVLIVLGTTCILNIYIHLGG